MSSYLDRSTHSLEQHLEALTKRLKTLPLTHPERADLTRQIVQTEDALAARVSL
jgi:hypothetical protein